jgi:hypothetical protein
LVPLVLLAVLLAATRALSLDVELVLSFFDFGVLVELPLVPLAPLPEPEVVP